MAQRVTKEDVQNAINELRADNQTPSNASIRKFVGYGSNSTINKYRKEILDSETSETIKTASQLSDDEITALGQTIGTFLTNRNSDLSDEFTNRLNTAEQTIEEQATTIEEQNKAIKGLEGEKKQLEDGTIVLNNDIATLNKELVELNSKNIDVMKMSGQVDLLKEQLATAQAEIAELKKPKTTRGRKPKVSDGKG